jgi:hypothetical protein
VTHSKDTSRPNPEFWKITPDKRIYQYDAKDKVFKPSVTLNWTMLK